MDFIKAHILKIFLILYGIGLCFWSVISPLSNDELSALSRIDYPSFLQFIEKGILADAHPPFVQLLLFLLVKLGLPIWCIKAIFSLFGTFSLLFLYKIGKNLSKSLCASLLPLAILAGSQIFITYAVQLRPYSVGLFFVLLQTLSLLKMSQVGKSLKTWAGLFTLATVLACFTHYIAALVVGIQALLAFWWIEKDLRKYYFRKLWLSGFFLVALLPFLIHQLGHKGLSWLNPPEWDFLLGFINYLAGYSYLGIIFTLGIIGLGVWAWNKEFLRFKLALAISILLSYLVLHLYSALEAPILQFSGLLFLYPLALILVCNLCLKEGLNRLVVILSFLISFGISWFYRDHFEIYQKQPFSELSKLEFKTKNDKEKMFTVSRLNPEYYQFYPSINLENSINLYGIGVDYSSFSNLLESRNAEIIRLVDPLPMMHDYMQSNSFEVINRVNCYTCDIYDYRRVPLEEISCDHEFSKEVMRYEIPLSDYSNNRSDFIKVSAAMKNPDSAVHLVAELIKGDEKILYGSRSFDNSGKTGELQLHLKLDHVVKSNGEMKDLTLRVYVWNPEGKELSFCKGIKIEGVPGNAIRYALFERLE